MTWPFYLLLILAAIVLYFLFAPVYIEIDSEHGLFRVRFHQLMSMRLFVKESLFMELRITWWHKSIDLLAARIRKIEPQKKSVTRKTTIPFQKIAEVLKTFKVRKCEVKIDSGDDYFNGLIFPWVLLLGFYFRKNIGMNFLGENKLVLEIKNNAARMLWAFLK